jgi:hypothetical protein
MGVRGFQGIRGRVWTATGWRSAALDVPATAALAWRMTDAVAAAAAGVMVLGLVTWAYGVYCYVQMVRHRRPGIPVLSVVWPAQHLTSRGLEFRRRALWSYLIFLGLAVVLILLGQRVG